MLRGPGVTGERMLRGRGLTGKTRLRGEGGRLLSCSISSLSSLSFSSSASFSCLFSMSSSLSSARSAAFSSLNLCSPFMSLSIMSLAVLSNWRFLNASLLPTLSRLLTLLVNSSMTWGVRSLPRGRVLVPLAPEDTQPSWVAGTEHPQHPQLVIIIFLGSDCDDENMAMAHLLQ